MSFLLCGVHVAGVGVGRGVGARVSSLFLWITVRRMKACLRSFVAGLSFEEDCDGVRQQENEKRFRIL